MRRAGWVIVAGVGACLIALTSCGTSAPDPAANPAATRGAGNTVGAAADPAAAAPTAPTASAPAASAAEPATTASTRAAAARARARAAAAAPCARNHRPKAVIVSVRSNTPGCARATVSPTARAVTTGAVDLPYDVTPTGTFHDPGNRAQPGPDPAIGRPVHREVLDPVRRPAVRLPRLAVAEVPLRQPEVPDARARTAASTCRWRRSTTWRTGPRGHARSDQGLTARSPDPR